MSEQLVAKLRYMGKQYSAGNSARGGSGNKHYLEEAAELIETLQTEVAAPKEAQRWIPVSKRLPDTDIVELYEVVIRNKKGHRFRQEVYWQSSEWEIPSSEYVEYWREIEPLPPPPPQEQDSRE